MQCLTQADVARGTYALFLKTVQGSAIKALFETLRDIMHEANLQFTPDGVRLFQLESKSHCVLAQLHLSADAFEEYHCPEGVDAGVSTGLMFTVVKGAGSSETVTMFMRADAGERLTLQVQDCKKAQVTTTEIPLLNIVSSTCSVPAYTFECVLTLPSADLARLCREAGKVGSAVTITVEERLVPDGDPECGRVTPRRCLEMRCEGLEMKWTNVLVESVQCLRVVQWSDRRIRNTFQLKFLNMICKAAGLDNNVELHLQDNFLMMLKFNVASLGTLTFIITPNDE